MDDNTRTPPPAVRQQLLDLVIAGRKTGLDLRPQLWPQVGRLEDFPPRTLRKDTDAGR